MQEHRLAAGASDIVDHGLAAGIIQVGNHYLGAFTRQCCRTCCADARCAAGDDRDLAVYLSHIAPSFLIQMSPFRSQWHRNLGYPLPTNRSRRLRGSLSISPSRDREVSIKARASLWACNSRDWQLAK
jgi:hypothetical protein